MERTPNDERFHVVVAVSPTPGVGWRDEPAAVGRWLGAVGWRDHLFRYKGMSCHFFLGNVPNGSKREKKNRHFFDLQEIGGHEI